MKMTSDVLDRPCAVPAHVVVRPFNDDAIALNMRSGTFHELNETAADMLERLRAAGRPRDVLAGLLDDYDAPAATVEADLAELVTSLRDRGILE